MQNRPHRPPLMLTHESGETKDFERVTSEQVETLAPTQMDTRSGAEPSAFDVGFHNSYQQVNFDQRQIHVSQDPEVMAQASYAVMEARSQTAEVMAQASHAVMEARSQTADIQDQAVKAVAEARVEAMETGLASHSQMLNLRNELVTCSGQ